MRNGSGVVDTLYTKCREEYREWFRSPASCTGTAALLCFRRSGAGRDGDAIVIDGNMDIPDDYELAHPMSLAWDFPRAEREIWKSLNTMPILAY